MQDVLPVGVAIVERVREQGFRKFVDFFSVSKDPFEELRKEGEQSASSLREQLDEINPGLGNPVMEVKVEVEEDNNFVLDTILMRIEDRLDLLELYLHTNQE